jgi:hypothetical protein
MNLEKVLSLVREVKKGIEESIKEDYSYQNLLPLIELEKTIIEEIKLEGFSETSQKTSYKRALSVLARNKQREVLRYAFTQNETQYFTDSYVAFSLKNAIKGLPEVPKEMTYPNVENIFQSIEKGIGSYASFTCQELKELVKLADTEFVDIQLGKSNQDETKARVNKKFLLDVLIILGYKNNEEAIVWYSPYCLGSVDILPPYTCKPLVFKRETNGLEDKAILLPIRVARPKEE